MAALRATAAALVGVGAVLTARRRAAPPPSPPPSAAASACGLTLEQAVAVDENADAICARVDAKAAALRRRAVGRLAAAVAVTVAAHRFHALAALAALLLALAFNLPLIRTILRSARNRRKTRATIAAARAAVRAARGATATASAFTGTWLKDGAASDSMDPALDLLQMGGIVRAAMAGVRGLTLRVSPDAAAFDLAVFSAIPLLKVRERYPLTGDTVQHRRRDLRGGGAAGRTQLRDDGSLQTTLLWRDPIAGACVDTYSVAGDELTVVTTLKVPAVGGRSVRYRTVYRRKG